MNKKRDTKTIKSTEELEDELDDYMVAQEEKRAYYKKRRVEAERDAYIKAKMAERIKRGKKLLNK